MTSAHQLLQEIFGYSAFRGARRAKLVRYGDAFLEVLEENLEVDS